MERIITSIKGSVLALVGKYLQRSRKIQRLYRCVSSLYLIVIQTYGDFLALTGNLSMKFTPS